jgi:hypothetical protein
METEKLKSKCFDLIRQKEIQNIQIQNINQEINKLVQEISKQEELNKKNKNGKK